MEETNVVAETVTPNVVLEGAPTTEVKVDAREALPAEAQSEFNIPDEYKEKGWASKVKSQEDLFKQIDNLDQLAGKKHVAFDYESSTPQEIEQHLATSRLKDKADYDFFSEEAPKENVEFFQDLFHKYGVEKYKAKGLTEAFREYEGKVVEARTSAEGFKQELEGSFGPNYETVGKEAASFIKQNIKETDSELINSMPNEYLGVMYRFADNVKKAYGANEGSASLNKTSVPNPVDINEARGKIREQISSLSKRPHTVEEKQKLMKQLNETYK